VTEQEIPINQPTLPSIDEVHDSLGEVLESRQVTNHRFVRRLEDRAREYLGVKHAVAVSSCTSGLILGIQALKTQQHRVVVPSFTFPATAHAVSWNGLEPVFADCEEGTFNVAMDSLESLIDVRTGALVGVPIFGNPLRGRALRELADQHGLPVVYDAAHAIGAKEEGRGISEYADVAVYSLAPTKILPAGEGGIVTTNDEALARRLRIGRNHGNPGNYDCEFAGLNARMSEFHAVIALYGLEQLEAAIERRTALVARYRGRLADVPGLRFQEVLPGNRCTYNYLAVAVEDQDFGLDADDLAQALRAENVGCRRYFYPPMHRQRIYASSVKEPGRLSRTDSVAGQVLCLPLYSHLAYDDLDRVCDAVIGIQAQSAAVRQTLDGTNLRSAAGGR
jgi:dTDP-4-amino-4,6-dideoxygalactose transaminase